MKNPTAINTIRTTTTLSINSTYYYYFTHTLILTILGRMIERSTYLRYCYFLIIATILGSSKDFHHSLGLPNSHRRHGVHFQIVAMAVVIVVIVEIFVIVALLFG
jgi:hypothetical protein